MRVPYLPASLLISVSVLLPCLGLIGSASYASAKNGDELEQVLVPRGKVHFVAVDGSDQGTGAFDRPWASINHAAEVAEAGDTVVVRGGHYVLSAQVRPRNTGRTGAWITFIGYPGESPILDAEMIPRTSLVQNGLDNGVFQIEDISYIRVAKLTVINSRDAGFTVRDSSHIDLVNNATKGTFSSGIAVWATNHDDKAEHVRILGNTITEATTRRLAPPDMMDRAPPPHEAISIGGAVDFEVAYNHVYDSDKEGIDVKETSKRGRVHHNVVHDVLRQGIYIDAWFGKIDGIEIFSNVIHDCRMAGIVLSVENGQSVENIDIHNNLIFGNDGSGLYFSRWGVDNPRRKIEISNNVFFHNGYGRPNNGQSYYWMTGGLYLYSANVDDIAIRDNIFSENRGFQIGHSDLFMRDGQPWQAVVREKEIQITGNLIYGQNETDSAIESGGDSPDRVQIYSVNGDRAIFADPLFNDPANQDFTLGRGFAAAVDHKLRGAYAPGSSSLFWWKRDFPPKMVQVRSVELK
jgi:hypothetical protein